MYGKNKEKKHISKWKKIIALDKDSHLIVYNLNNEGKIFAHFPPPPPPNINANNVPNALQNQFPLNNPNALQNQFINANNAQDDEQIEDLYETLHFENDLENLDETFDHFF